LGKAKSRGTKKKVSPSSREEKVGKKKYCQRQYFGSFASGKNKGRKKSSFPLWGNRKEKNFVLPKVNKKKGEEKKGNVFMSSLGISSGTSPEGM
jgi:type 1 glutamine amidotransferase